jgi:small GTP-binding protein
MTPEEQIKEIEDEIARTQYNKATEKHIGKLKAKIALLRAQASKSGGKKGVGYSVKKGGDATILLVGFPSVGKSTLLNQLTNAESKIGDYEFTTLDVIPGVMEYNGAKLQILDVPGMVEGAASGKGRGKEILSVIRNADLILIMADIEGIDKIDIIKKELYDAGFRLNKNPPDVKIQKKSTGGINVTGAETSGLGRDTVVSILNEFGVINADVIIREKLSLDQGHGFG